MNIAIIFAGGTGQRMKTSSKPKQFLELYGKPIIVYTLEHFQSHYLVDGIVVVCIESWIQHCKELLRKYNISKVSCVVSGGSSGQESIFNGLKAAFELYPDDSIVLIHDGVRPLINGQLITDDIECAKRKGSAITVSPAVETIILKQENGNVGAIFDRTSCEMARAPQCFYLKEIYNIHLKARKEGKNNFIDSASLMKYYGYELSTVVGPYENFKITTPADFYIFRAIIDAKKSMQILGL
ncbi:MAG: IspD/TarI family cytidylyltransferase [Acidaminococcaceae bacterium]|nr:IspD/TarI family cytidylyltransferase [Acidaminococcaceae bacterium]